MPWINPRYLYITAHKSCHYNNCVSHSPLSSKPLKTPMDRSVIGLDHSRNISGWNQIWTMVTSHSNTPAVHHGFHEICSDSLATKIKWDSKLSTFKHKVYNHGEKYLYVLRRQSGEATSDQVCHLASQESWQADGINIMPPELNVQTNERILKLHSRGGYHINSPPNDSSEFSLKFN